MEDLGDRDFWSYRNEPWPDAARISTWTLWINCSICTRRAHLAAPVEPPQLQAEFNAELYRWEQNYFLENCLVPPFRNEVEKP